VSNPLPPGATGTDQTFAPALLGAFREGVSVLEQGIQQIKAAWNGLINAVNGFIQRVNDYLDDRHFWQKPFDWLFDDLQEGCEKLKSVISQVQEKVNSILDTVQKSVNGSFPVFSLFEVGMDWGTKVKTPLSDISPDLTPSGKIDSWRGPATRPSRPGCRIRPTRSTPWSARSRPPAPGCPTWRRPTSTSSPT